jgi:hypothetical protein
MYVSNWGTNFTFLTLAVHYLSPSKLKGYFIFLVSIPLCYIKFRNYTLSNTTRWILMHFNIHFSTLATCFGYVLAILRPTRTVGLALDAALSAMKHLLFASIVKTHHTPTTTVPRSITWTVFDFIVLHSVSDTKKRLAVYARHRPPPHHIPQNNK